MTSRWVVEASAVRGVPVRWRTFSLALKNADVEVPEPYRSLGQVALGALRVVEAVWAERGDDAVGPLYTELGRRFHLQGRTTRESVAAAVAACGLDPAFLRAADDDALDTEILGSMSDAIALVGAEVAVPILAFHDDGEVYGISGPIMSAAPTGDEALSLWDHVLAVVRMGNVYELKRGRAAPPQFAR